MRYVAVVALLSSTLLPPAAAQTPYDTLFDQIKNLAPSGASAVVHGLALHRDVMELRLDSGTAYLLTSVGGHAIGVAYLGSGSISFVPPLPVEQANLQRVMGDSTLNGPISGAVLIFADSTQAELERAVTFAAAAPSGGAPADEVHDALEYLMDGRERYVYSGLMSALLNGTRTGYFAAYIARKRGESVMIQIDPAEAEAVMLLRRGHLMDQRTETVCQFQRAEDLQQNVAAGAKQAEPLQLDAYEIDATIDGSYHFSSRVKLRLVGVHDTQRWARFQLFSALDVDSVLTESGAPLTYYRKNRTSPLWVHFAQPIGVRDTQYVRVVYHGGLIGFGSALDGFLPPWWDPRRQQLPPVLDTWAFIRATSTWYPRYSFEQPASVTLTFHTPKNLKLATIGRLVDSHTDGDVVTTRWESELPTTQVSFNIGHFNEFEIKDPRIPPVTVHINSDAHSYIAQYIPHARRPEEQVGSDVANSLSFFTQMYGKPLFQRYYATEIPYFHGQAFPGMIHLSWWTFLNMSSSGDDEAFRAHEMAHQWWGIGVAPATYRDVWLAEGFAEFSGLWYMQTILRDNDKYFTKLREAREQIRRERVKAVPIALGIRATESRSGNYDLIMYQKGAWVLHMLRNMMLDRRTMSEDRFKQMMQSFYATYRGGRASTEDFQRAVEHSVGGPMGWFFDEWVYGTAIPTYTFSWNAEPGAAGKYTAHVRVRQEDVPDGFVMPVPILIQFEEGQALVRVVVKGPLTEASFDLPEKPKRLELNPLESVLAEVHTEDWDKSAHISAHRVP